jgi:hypothetical protein
LFVKLADFHERKDELDKTVNEVIVQQGIVLLLLSILIQDRQINTGPDHNIAEFKQLHKVLFNFNQLAKLVEE